MTYQIKKTLLGKSVVRYACGHCGISLESPLADAGRVEPCPSCGVQHTVPGEAERIAQEREEKAQREAQIQRQLDAVRARKEKGRQATEDRETREAREALERLEEQEEAAREIPFPATSGTTTSAQAAIWSGGQLFGWGVALAVIGGFIAGLASAALGRRETGEIAPIIFGILGLLTAFVGGILQFVGLLRIVFEPFFRELMRQNEEMIGVLRGGGAGAPGGRL